jgi:hypothetical protein
MSLTASTSPSAVSAELRALAALADNLQTRADVERLALSLQSLVADVKGQVEAAPSWALESPEYRARFESLMRL